MSDEEKPTSSSIIEEDVSEMEVVDASAVEDSNNEDDERKVCLKIACPKTINIFSLGIQLKQIPKVRKKNTRLRRLLPLDLSKRSVNIW